MSIPITDINNHKQPPLLSLFEKPEEPKAPITPPPTNSYGKYVGRALLAGAATYLASHVVYNSYLSPSVNPGVVSDLLFSNQTRDCDSKLHKLQTDFFNHYERGRYPLSGAATAYLREHNFEAIQCLIDSKEYLGDDFAGEESYMRGRIFEESVNIIGKNLTLPRTSDFIKTFIKKGMDPNLNEYSSRSGPLDIALKIKDQALVQFLLDKGASVTNHGSNHLHNLASKHFTQSGSSFDECELDLKMINLMLKSKSCDREAAKRLASSLFSMPSQYIEESKIDTCKKASYVYMDRIKCWGTTKKAQKFLNSLHTQQRGQRNTHKQHFNSNNFFNNFFNNFNKDRGQYNAPPTNGEETANLPSSCKLLGLKSSATKKTIRSDCRKELAKRHPDSKQFKKKYLSEKRQEKGKEIFIKYNTACEILKKSTFPRPCS